MWILITAFVLSGGSFMEFPFFVYDIFFKLLVWEWRHLGRDGERGRSEGFWRPNADQSSRLAIGQVC